MMADFALTPDHPLTLPSRRVKVHVASLGTVVRVDLLLRSDNLRFPLAHPLTAGQWLVQEVTSGNTDAVTVRLRPRDTDAFPAGARFQITLELVGNERSATDVVRLMSRDASGLDQVDVVQLAPAGAEPAPGVRMSVPSGDVSPTDLSGRAREALTAVRRHLATERVPAREAVRVVVLIDGSASMRGARESGVVTDVVESLRGLSVVIAGEGGFAAYVVDDELTPVSAQDPGWGEAVAAAMRARGGRVGFRLLRPEPDKLSAGRTVTYVVTDAPPTALSGLAADVDGYHIVMLGSELTLRAFGVDPAIPSTVWEPTVRSLQDGRGAALVASLLRGCFDEGSAMNERLSR